METIRDVILMMRQGCSFASVDFKHAFFSIKIKHEDRQYLRFVWQGNNYQFTCLPQGLVPASRVFTKILKPVYSHQRSHDIEISGYIDDSISVCDDYAEHELQMDHAVKLFDQLGFTVTPKNLGFVLDSQKMTVTLTDSKEQCIHDLAVKIMSKPSFPISDLAQFLGKLAAAEPGPRINMWKDVFS